MCGISIAISRKGEEVTHSLIKAMNDKVIHRGPDDEGYYRYANFAFGHRRLSILDLSIAGHQPMQRGPLWITYNGEVYNYIELREELKTLGYTFHTATDTEVILAAYEEWGAASFTRFNGMWAFAIYDERKNEIVCSRDHFGIKPLYFTQTADYFLAGSEIKQFTAVEGFRPVLNKSVTVNFLAHGWLNYSSETFFDGVSELRPGHSLVYDLRTNQFSINEWYNLNQAVKPVSDSYDVAVDRINELFSDSVKIRMRSDVKVGSCLSGGIDSSSIIALIHQNDWANSSFATVTSCYEDKRYDEQQYSELVTAQTGFQSLKVYPDLSSLWNGGDLDKIIYHQDQPIASGSHYSEYKVFETARDNGLIVMQDGQGSDEYLCGYGEFYTISFKELLRTFRWSDALSLIKDKARHNHTGILQQFCSFIKSAYLPNQLKRLKKIIGKELYPWLSPEWQKLAEEKSVNFERDTIKELSIAEIVHSSLPYQLHSEDRNSMLFSVESRLPFLAPRLVEYALGLPASYKIRDGYTKAVLRDAIGTLPEPIKERKDKMGFEAPDVPWMRQNKDRVRAELVALVEQTGIFSEQLIHRFDKFAAGKLGYEPIYFRALAFQRFCKIFDLKY
jgi:asparagine synthase (glutamine-hydrolysing)